MVSGISGGGLRLPGLATGMDTDDMIKKMLMGQQAKIDKVKQDKQIIAWKQEMYKDIIKDVKDLQNTYFSSTSKDSLINNKNYFDYIAKVNSGVSANITAGQGAIEGNYIVDVIQMAKGATVSGKLQYTDGSNKNVTNDTKLSELGIDKNFTITVDGKEFTVDVEKLDKSKATVKDLVSSIKNSSFEVDGKTEKLSDYINVSFSELSQEISIETKKTGEGVVIAIGGDNKVFDVSTIDEGKNSIAEITAPGSSAKVKVERDSNNFTIDGITYKLTEKGETNINISKNVDQTFDRIKGFMDKYNALIEKISGKLKEKKDYDYKPLTEEQKKEMKDDDIKAWEERAKKGALRNDSNLEKMLSDLRGVFYDKVEGSNISFGRKQTGLDTSSDTTKSGQIEFGPGGEETLKKILMENPEDIMNLFNKMPSISNPKTSEEKKQAYNESGIFQRINTIIKDYAGLPGVTLGKGILTDYANKQEDNSIYGVIGSNNLPDQLHRKDIMIKNLSDKMKEKEKQLYRQFATLEKVMNKYNSQAAWMAQQFGGQ
ncbi:flagellar filament capping protein FliD [Clostridium sp. MSJ-11]|uniref:Flagellar hook-associated protein 2 n=1 Tax=Clostridium mobile TaxID=2841512 RepID=A0ABS6EF25_9CLOT|nr:flagellar filament capping protein FliD [Clostridium mobile]MBU5483070.1 flagellar filament capping protein FliD [Clostridium mobile]